MRISNDRNRSLSMWQDLVITLGQLVFIVALWPALFSTEKPPLATSLITGCTLFILAITYGTLGLWFSTVAGSIVAIEWFILAIQVFRKNSQKPFTIDRSE